MVSVTAPPEAAPPAIELLFVSYQGAYKLFYPPTPFMDLRRSGAICELLYANLSFNAGSLPIFSSFSTRFELLMRGRTLLEFPIVFLYCC